MASNSYRPQHNVSNEKIIVRKTTYFDLPKRCSYCPLHSTEHDMNATIEFCNHPNFPRGNSCAFVDGDKRSDKCPLHPGDVIDIGAPYKTTDSNVTDDPNRCWQPVSKRLPKKDGWYLAKRESSFTDRNGVRHKSFHYETQRFVTSLKKCRGMMNPPDRPGFYQEDYNTGGTESELKDVIAWMNC